jgi:EmrB/QacA subfamily drug resistance transporter
MSRARNPWHILLVLCLGQSVALMDTTIVNVAIPAIVEGTGATFNQVLWVINGYVLTYAVLVVTGGRLGDLFGQKRAFMVGLGLFTAASVSCGLAADPTQLIAARLVQGVGGAILTPQALAIVSHIFPPERRGAALGVWGAFVSAAAAIGPTVGGLVVSLLGWRWVFFVNVPIAVTAIVLSAILVPDLRGGRRPRLDVLGTVVLMAALTALVYAMVEGTRRGWGPVVGPVTAPVLLMIGVALLVVFAVVERGRQDRDPLVPFTVLRDRDFAVMSLVVAALPFGLGAMLLLTSVNLQFGRGLSAMTTGIVLAGAPIVSVLVSPFGGRLTDRFGGKYVLIAGFGLFAGGLGALALAAAPDMPWIASVPAIMLTGAGMGMVFSPPAAIAMRGIPPALSGAASGLFNMTRLSGSLLGAAAVGAVLQSRLSSAFSSTGVPDDANADVLQAATGADGVDLAALSALGGPAWEATFRQAVLEAVQWTYLLPVAVLVAGALGTLTVTRRRSVAVPA